MPRAALLLATATLFALAAGYAAKGTYELAAGGGAGDLWLRWQEQQYVFRSKNPFDVFNRWYAEQHSLPVPDTARDAGIDADLGVPGPGYPPWAYVTGAVFTWPPDWAAARWYYAGINLALLAAIGWWALRVGGAEGQLAGPFFAAASLAAGSLCNTVGNGQYGVVVLASLVGAWWFDRQGRAVLAGLLLGVALIKPTLSLPFLLPFLVKRRWTALLTAGAYLGAASAVVWGLTGTDPVAMLRQMVEMSAHWRADGGSDPIALLSGVGVRPELAMRFTAAGVITAAVALEVLWRRASMLTLFAIAALAGRLWTYHRHYDDLILVFLLLALGGLAARRDNRLALVAFAALGLVLWLPQRALGAAEVKQLLMLVWVASGTVLLAQTPRQPLRKRELAPTPGAVEPGRA